MSSRYPTRRAVTVKPKRKPTRAPARPAKRAPVVAPTSQSLELMIRGAERLPAPVDVVDAHVLGEEAAIGQLGLAELKLTAEENAVLDEGVPVDRVLVKPSGNGVIYLSHPDYTKWFNRAFGRLGWSLVPAAAPKKSGNLVVRDYLLFVHGKAVAFATGEQDYFDNNPEQTYGDALEATVASALRRCAKRLGVGLELWDKEWCNRFLADRCVRVNLATGKSAWRRKSDPPFWNEQGGSKAATRQPAPAARPKPVDATHAKTDDPITEEQRKRLWDLVKRVGRDKEDVREWLEFRYRIAASKDLKRRDYDEACAFIEARGPLPAAREPGED